MEELKELKEQLKELEQRIRVIEEDRKLNNYQYKQIIEVLTALKEDITSLKEAPARNWNVVITALITGVVTFCVSYFFKI